MRILLTGDELHPHGGVERSLVELAAGLARAGHDIDVLYRRPGQFLPELQETCRAVRQVPGYLVERDHLARSAVGAIRCVRTGAALRPDVVLVQRYQDTPAAAGVAVVRQCPLVCHARGRPPQQWGRQWTLAMRRVDRMIAVSEHTRRQFVTAGVDERRTRTVPIGIDPSRYRPVSRADAGRLRRDLGIGADEVVVLYAGRIDRDKGLEVLLDAWARLDARATGPGRLVIAGAPRDHRDDQAAANYVARLRHLSGERCVWVGRQQDIVPWLQLADLAVLATPGDEAFGRIVVEALACGTPIVASAVGGVPEILTGALATLLVPPANPTALAAAIGRLWSWRQTQPELADLGRRHVAQHYSLDAMVTGVVECLDEAVRERSCS